MDMHNAAAAGPSRGLLDILFGTNKDAEAAEAGGQGFDALMNFVKAMNGEKSEEQSAVIGRTQRETTRGKGAVDNGADGMPGMNAASAVSGEPVPMVGQEEKERGERLQELSALLGIPVPVAAQAPALKNAGQEPIPALKPGQVNAALKQKDLPPLDKEELKLLQAVNSKLEQAQAPKVAGAGTAAIAADQALDPRLQQEMAKKGIDPSKLKGTEVSGPASGAPEKMVSTEAYLQMHESVGKAPAKEAAVKDAQAAGADVKSPQTAAQGSLTSAAVAEAGSKGLGLAPRKERDGDVGENPRLGKPEAPNGAFGAALAQQPKGLSHHQVNLSGLDKPEQLREAMMGEVAPGVALHAHKGGGEMRLVVTPEDMGEVKLKVSTKNGKVEVQVTAESNDVAQIIRGGSHELEASLKDQNLSLGKFEVSVADSNNVSSLDNNKSNLSEQFLSQGQQGFGQGAADEGRGNRWGGDQNPRQGGSYASMADDNGRSSPNQASAAPRKQMARSSQGRLDVVA